MDVMGPRWCNDNLEYLVDWIEEEADERGLFEDDELQKRMEKYLRRSSRTMRIWFAWAPASLQHRMRESNWARRVAIRRLLITFIRRSCRHSTPPEITSHHAINVPNTTS